MNCKTLFSEKQLRQQLTEKRQYDKIIICRHLSLTIAITSSMVCIPNGSRNSFLIDEEEGSFLIVLGFNDMSTLMYHFVSSPREREKRDGRDSRRDEREGQGRKREMKESEGT